MHRQDFTSMQKLTLRVISGADRGRVFRELKTPLTIGREEGNTIQLNDERVSRYHVKIQEDDGRLVVTDLESTNGTRVNGHPCSLKILRYGDTIAIGRSVLLVGTREQIAEWFSDNPTTSVVKGDSILKGEESNNKCDADSIDLEYSTGLLQSRSVNSSSHEVTVPRGLSPGQAAELRELLHHLHVGIQQVMDNGMDQDSKVIVDARAWQSLLVLQSDISELIRAIEEPPESSVRDLDTGT
jgi:Inner membrane component of T3SS, cytoplasmic domain